MPAAPDAISSLRDPLFAFAYRLTGHAADSEDIVQEVLANWFAANHGHVADPRRYLLRAVKNRCLTLLARRPPRPTGTELPEPLVQPRYAPEASLDVSFGLWLTLATLTPLERAVLLLRESFAYDHEELAELLEIQVDYCRQLYHRGRQRLVARQPRFQPSLAAQAELLAAFQQAVTAGNLTQLVRLLKQDVAIYADGGRRPAARPPVFGAPACGRYLLGLQQKFARELRSEVAVINNSLGLLLFEAGNQEPDTTLSCQQDKTRRVHQLGNFSSPPQPAGASGPGPGIRPGRIYLSASPPGRGAQLGWTQLLSPSGTQL